MLGDSQQRAAQLRVAAETLGAADEPEVELVLETAEVGQELGVIAVGIVDEVAGVDFEELRQQQTRGVGEVRARAGFDLRQVALRERLLHLRLDGPEKLLLGHRAAETAQAAFDFAQVTDFVAQLHLVVPQYCDMQYVYR